jgi:hypothetical protein
MPRSRTSSTARGYGRAYQRRRAELLAGGATCHWCGAPATTADHEPPIQTAGPHLDLVPACDHCNFSRRGAPPAGSRPSPSREW